MRPILTIITSLALASFAAGQTFMTPIKNGKMTGALDVSAITNKAAVRTALDVPQTSTALTALTSALTYPSSNVSPLPNALRITSSGAGDSGVLDLQNAAGSGNDFSAVNFLNTAGHYRLSIGYGNTSFPAFASAAYIEANNLVGNNQVPPDFNIVQTGTDSVGGYTQSVRASFIGNGHTKFYGRDAGGPFGTEALWISPAGRVRVGVAGSLDPDNAALGFAQFMQLGGQATAVSITQNNIATAFMGFPATSTHFVLGTDGGLIRFRQNPTATLAAGTDRFWFDLANGRLGVGTAITPAAAVQVEFSKAADYDGVLVKNTSSTGISYLSAQNSAGHNCSLYVGGAGQSVRTAYGITGEAADLTADVIPLYIGTATNQNVYLAANNAVKVSVENGGFRVGTGGTVSSRIRHGTATLSGGTVTVADTAVTASSRIMLTVQSLGTVTAPKAVGVTARTASTSFTITSEDATDTSVVAWEMIEP